MAEPIRYHFEVGGHRGGGKAWICAGRDDKICLSVLVLPLFASSIPRYVYASGVKTGPYFYCFLLMHLRTILMLWGGVGLCRGR